MKDKTILLDSGKVLNGPITGHWMIPPNFFNIVDKNKFNCIHRKKKVQAFRVGMNYINTIKFMKNMDEEYNHFIEFYRLFSEHLPELGLNKEMLEELARDLVFNLDKYKFYNDAIDIIPKLYEEYTLSVVSDAWPSLEEVFSHNDFDKYFDSFINSSRIGVSKPDEKMYLSALNQTGHTVTEAIFVDDRIRNCDGAKNIGISKTYLLCRGNMEYIYRKLFVRNHIVVKNLYMIYDDLKNNK